MITYGCHWLQSGYETSSTNHLIHYMVLPWGCIDVTEAKGEGVRWEYLNGLVQDCSNSTANALELPRSCTKPSIWLIWWCIIILLSRRICDFKCLIFKCNYVIDILNISSGFVPRWITQDHIDNKSKLIQAMTWQQAITCTNIDPDL